MKVRAFVFECEQDVLHCVALRILATRGDVCRPVNLARNSPHGGVLAIAGDDHSGESSTVVHASDYALSDAMIPVLAPAGVQEIIDYGLMGFALSRYAGVWVGLKCVHDTVESAAVVEAGPERADTIVPRDHALPAGGLSIRPSDDRHEQERRLYTHKMPAVAAFARANRLNRVVLDGGASPRLGIVASGKAYLDVRQALDDLGIDAAGAARLGIRLLKIGMVWPLEPDIVRAFAQGLGTVMVVEEKRPLIETQIKDILYAEQSRPAVIGKQDEQGGTLFAAHGVIEPGTIAMAIAARIADRATADCAADLAQARSAGNQAAALARVPYFCAGCPHNSSTVLPEGARGYAGIGCHWLAQFVPGRKTEGATHMGGEGANWVGEQPFSTRGHVFQNIGDGTYNHSGLMAIRHAVGTGTTITYKILFNDAVAMTGGQRNDGGLSVPQIAQQMRAIGVERIAVVTDEPDKYPSRAIFPERTSVHHRSELQAVQTEMMAVKGTSVIIYDQTCAAEKRRRRKRGAMAEPERRVIINELVCEGCGDCSVQSNCVAVQPVDTEFGRKRRIDQSSCNKDFSCLKGFCPSFVTVEGGAPAKGGRSAVPPPASPLAEPSLPALSRPWNILITGIGGTGVVTIGHILGMAAFIEGKGAALIDMVGISQKNGAVVTHLKIAAKPGDIASVRVARGSADLILGCDLVTSASAPILATAARGRTAAVVNSHEAMPAQFIHNPDLDVEGGALTLKIGAAVKSGALHAVEATAIAARLMGDAIAANLFTLGFAWQKGLVPVSRQAIEEAVRLNGVAVDLNLAAFAWGRRMAADPGAVTAATGAGDAQALPETLDTIVARRVAFLADYQDRAYAERYRAFVEKVRGHSEPLALAVARNLFKLMAYKDEYEVARLHSDGTFARQVEAQFSGPVRLTFHLAPPVLGRMDKATGRPAKTAFGPWMMTGFKVLARMKRLRGTAFDPFGRTAERRAERQLIADYRARIENLLPGLRRGNLETAIAIAALPATIRGFGPVKEASMAKAKALEVELVADFERSGGTLKAAAE